MGLYENYDIEGEKRLKSTAERGVLLIGTSGWVYPHWTGLFYKDKLVDKLEFYSKIFDTVEVNMTFYRMPSPELVSLWASKTPSNFKFSFKVSRLITHFKRLTGAEPYLQRFLNVLKPLQKKGKLGAVLLQFPPNFTIKERPKLETFCQGLPDNFHFAVEFRSAGWISKETWALLSKYNVAYAIIDSPIKALSKPVVTTATHTFIRWHGRGGPSMYNYDYSRQQLRSWQKKLDHLSKQVGVLYGYFNNDVNAYAPFNAIQLIKMARLHGRTEHNRSAQVVV